MNFAAVNLPLLATPPLALPVVATAGAAGASADAVDFGQLLLAQPAGQVAVAQTRVAQTPVVQEPVAQAAVPLAMLREVEPVGAAPVVPADRKQPLSSKMPAKPVEPESELKLPAQPETAEPVAAKDEAVDPAITPAAPVEQAPPPPQPPVIALAQPAPVQALQTTGANSDRIKRADPAKNTVGIVVLSQAEPQRAGPRATPGKPAVPAVQPQPVKADVAPLAPIEFIPAPQFAVAEAVEAALPALRPEAADPVVQVGERVLDVARGSQWLDQLASDIIAAQDSDRDLNFRLMPPQLGQLDVRIETQDAGMQLSFETQTKEAAQIVAAAQPRLVEELRGQGVRIAGSEVATSSGQSSNGGQPQRQPFAPQQEPQFHRPTKHSASAQSGRFA